MAGIHARRRQAFLRKRRGEENHRRHGCLQDEPLPLAPYRRPGMAHRNQEIPPPHRGRGMARKQGTGMGRHQARRTALRRMLYTGRCPRSGGICTRTVCGNRTRSGYPRTFTGSGGSISRISQLRPRQTARGVAVAGCLYRCHQCLQPQSRTVCKGCHRRACRHLPLPIHPSRRR